MPTVTQRARQMDSPDRYGIGGRSDMWRPCVVAGTETAYPGRSERRRLAREARHEAALKIARLLNG
jgi:hypothetical protein